MDDDGLYDVKTKLILQLLTLSWNKSDSLCEILVSRYVILIQLMCVHLIMVVGINLAECGKLIRQPTMCGKAHKA